MSHIKKNQSIPVKHSIGEATWQSQSVGDIVHDSFCEHSSQGEAWSSDYIASVELVNKYDGYHRRVKITEIKGLYIESTEEASVVSKRYKGLNKAYRNQP